MEEIFKTKSAEERNEFIEKCYKENIKYSYSDKLREGYYIIKFEKNRV